MAKIAAYHQRLVKEDVFGLFWSHTVPFPILVDIAVVPVKAGAILQGIHHFSIRLSYTRTERPIVRSRVPVGRNHR